MSDERPCKWPPQLLAKLEVFVKKQGLLGPLSEEEIREILEMPPRRPDRGWFADVGANEEDRPPPPQQFDLGTPIPNLGGWLAYFLN
jgi:hypothetical protein